MFMMTGITLFKKVAPVFPDKKSPFSRKGYLLFYLRSKTKSREEHNLRRKKGKSHDFHNSSNLKSKSL